MSLLKKLPNIKENINLSQHTTFRIGGPARYFFMAQSKDDFVTAIRRAKEEGAPFYILGGGSNMLVSDNGFDGLVIKYNFSSQKEKKEGNKLDLLVDAGTLFNKVIIDTVRNGYSGVEWGFGIPGTIGGAVYGNAGRLGEDISSVIKKVKVLDEKLNEKELDVSECNFGYRSSRFKKTGEIILEATLGFSKKDKDKIDEKFGAAKDVIAHSPKFPSAGCAFKNYKTTGPDDALLQNHPELKERVRGGKIGVGFLIDQAGMKGKRVGGAQVWEGHANYIVNVNEATGKDVKKLMDNVVGAVAEKYGIWLTPEIRLLGF